MSGAQVAGLVLAGGRGSRLGATLPKPLVAIAGRPLIAYVLERFPPWITPLLVSANDSSAFDGLGLAIVPDRIEGFHGPLAGLDAGAALLRQKFSTATHLLALPGDTPFLPPDIADRMAVSPSERPRIASCGGRLQPTAALWPLSILDGLPAYLAENRDRSLIRFAKQNGFDEIAFEASGEAPQGDPFFNVNTPVDLEEAHAALDV